MHEKDYFWLLCWVACWITGNERACWNLDNRNLGSVPPDLRSAAQSHSTDAVPWLFPCVIHHMPDLQVPLASSVSQTLLPTMVIVEPS